MASVKVHAASPVVLYADTMTYDQEQQIVTAYGNVEVSQGEAILLADRLIYRQNENVVLARGNVSVLEESGNVFFADEVELKDDLERGLIQEFKVRMNDQSTMVARSGERLDPEINVLENVAYTPCFIKCEQGKDKTPTWSMKARKATVNEYDEKIYYHHTYFEVMDVPIMYSPYLSHATPDAENKSGLLIPSYERNDNLGNIYSVPIYISLAEDKDMTITPVITTDEGLIMEGEYRQRFNRGQIEVDSSITNPRNRDNNGDLEPGRDLRGHIFADGEYITESNWRLGFDINRTTDDTYLRRYDISSEPLLESRVFAETKKLINGNDRNYFVVEGLAFQGLTLQDDRDRSPLVLPYTNAYYETDPMLWGSRFYMHAGALALRRDQGAESNRITVDSGWTLPLLLRGGHMLTFDAEMQADGYSVDDVLQPDGTLYEGTTGRLFPQASLTWRYPLINSFENSSLTIEPIVKMIASPGGGNPSEIPNEDSALPEFSETNLFSGNRFPGVDRVETGHRVSYGMQGEWDVGPGQYVRGMVGQAYRFTDDREFPIASELDSRFSDYVGNVSFNYAPIYGEYRYRLSQDNYNLTRSEATAGTYFWRLGLNGTYFRVKDDPILLSREEVSGSASVRLTDHWTWFNSVRRDIEIARYTSINTGLSYSDECAQLVVNAGRDFTTDRDKEQSTTILFQVILKNLN